MIQKIDVELVLSNLADLPNTECCVFDPICGSPLHQGCLSPTAFRSFNRLDALNDQRDAIGNPIPPFLLSNWLTFSMICRKKGTGLVRIAHLIKLEGMTMLTLRRSSG